MSISKHNKAAVRFKVDTEGFDYKKLGDLYDEKTPETVHSVYGLYISTKGKFGESPFAASDGYFISLPQHLTDTVKEILADSESVAQINDCKAGLIIRAYEDANGITRYSAIFCDVEAGGRK